MEGSWRAMVAVVVVACAALGTGCGEAEESGADPAAIRTADVERTFAPLLLLPAGEELRPMSARWFIERSIASLAEDGGCSDQRMAVGHTLPERQNPVTDWIYPKGLGQGPTYFRNPNRRGSCERSERYRIYADDLTRPHDPGVRVERLRPGQGYYLDLVDDARSGPRELADAAVYSERVDEGDGAVRLKYWILYGAQVAGRDGRGTPREGDWERVDVLLRDAGDDGYVPLAVQLGTREDGTGEVAWSALRRTGETHPVVTAERGSHALSAARGGTPECDDCDRWATWKILSDARAQPWYGFGGAWGEVGATSATTGPLGPHGDWPTTYQDHR